MCMLIMVNSTTYPSLPVIKAVFLLFSASCVLSLSAGFVARADSRSSDHSDLTVVPLHEPIQPIPLTLHVDQRLAKLGEKLFNDRQLEKTGRISCAHCHDLTKGGADAKRSPESLNNPTGSNNTLSIFNVAFNKRYYWTNRFESLDHQLDDAIGELGLTWKELQADLNHKADYITLFHRVFPDGITIPNIKQAFIAYERSLITPNSRFDQYLRGNKQALDHTEQKGYTLFKSYGCIACHQGINLGGNLSIALSELYREKHIFKADNIPKDHNSISLTERGDTIIRVPSLRNVAITAPYFHDGSAATLELAVIKMAGDQSQLPIPYGEIKMIVAFLNTLTGEYNGKAL